MRVAICACVVGVAATAAALPRSETCGGTTIDRHGNETEVVCGTVADYVNGSGGSGSGGGHGIPSGHTGTSGPIRNRSPDRRHSTCESCREAFEEHQFLSHVTREACLDAGAAKATDLCENRHVMPNGTLVEDYFCTADGRCSGRGIERCKEAYMRGMNGIAIAEGENGGFSVSFRVVLTGGGTRTETTSWDPATGYLSPCYNKAGEIHEEALVRRRLCAEEVLQARRGVCTF